MSNTLTIPIDNNNSICALGINGKTCMNKDATATLNKIIGNDSSLSDELIVNEIKKKTGCDNELCILKNSSVNLSNEQRKINLLRIKPMGPSNSTTLMNNNNIDSILHRLTQLYPHLYHINFQMIDFAGEKDSAGEYVQKNNYIISPTHLGTIDIVNDCILKKYTNMCVVLNTHTRDKRGEHWFCIFCDFRTSPFSIEYFNSTGNKPVHQVQDWINKAHTQISNSGYKVEKKILTGMQHQQKNTECGVYSIYYIYNRLKGIPIDNFQIKRITDESMVAFRKMLFINENDELFNI
jgi:hypothetical protein